MRWSGRQSSLGGVPITGICLVRYGKPGLAEPIHCGDQAVREIPGLPYKFPISMYLAAETRLWPDLGGQTIFSAETTFCRTNHPQTNFSPAERHLAGEIHRGDRYGKPRPCRTKSIAETGAVRETPGLPYRTFTPPDFHARAGSGFLFFCHGAQTFPVGLRGAAAFCGTNRVKLRSASAPQSRYYF